MSILSWLFGFLHGPRKFEGTHDFTRLIYRTFTCYLVQQTPISGIQYTFELPNQSEIKVPPWLRLTNKNQQTPHGPLLLADSTY